jgi:glycosyltransferase involved in cell wall biosynthesis
VLFGVCFPRHIGATTHMTKIITLHDQELNQAEALSRIISLAQSGRMYEGLPLFKQLSGTSPTLRNFELIKAVYTTNSASTFLPSQALHRELEAFPDNEAARILLQEIEERRNVGRQQASLIPKDLIFSVILVAHNDPIKTQISIKAALHQLYPSVELVVVQCDSNPLTTQSLLDLDPRIRVLEAAGASHWEAFEFGLQNAAGDYQILVPDCSVIFSDLGLCIAASYLQTTPQAHFLAGQLAYIDEYNFILPRRVEYPRFSRSSFLDERSLFDPISTLDFTSVLWSKQLFRKVGNKLETKLQEAIDFELFVRFFRETRPITFPTLLAAGRQTVIGGGEKRSVRFIQEALTLIRQEKQTHPLTAKDETAGDIVNFTNDRKEPSPEKKNPGPHSPLTLTTGHKIQSLWERLPRVTLVMPSYNQAQFLEEAINSVLSQGYPRLEFIIMDGGSTDGSVEIIRRYESHLSYWCSMRDHGQYFAIQKGFDLSRGEIMGWLNSDDKLYPSALGYLGLTFLLYPHVRWITSKAATIHLSGRETLAGETFLFSREHYLKDGFDRPYIPQEGTFWRRSLWEEAGGALDLRWSLAADMELWCRFFRFSQLQSIDIPLGQFRVQPQQRSQVSKTHYLREAGQITLHELQLIHSGWHTEMLPAPEMITEAAILAAVDRLTGSLQDQLSYQP